MTKLKGNQVESPVAFDWEYPKKAAERLQIYVLKLGRLRRAGALKEGYHYRDVSPPGAGRSSYQYHVPRVTQLLSTPASRRKRYG